MRIHIICSQLDTDKILPRLAKQLAKDAGFTISENPDDTADLNYFFIYLEYKGYNKTKTAALFSHLEENSPSKSKEWHRVAREVDIRLTWALKYKNILEQYGITFQVTPFIDLEKFKFVSS